MKPSDIATGDATPIQIPEAAISFDNTEVAFASKSKKDLRRAYLLFRIIGNRFLSTIGKHATRLALALRLPITPFVRATIYQQFVGGESIEKSKETSLMLRSHNIGTILDYSVEGKEAEADFDRTRDEILRTVVAAGEEDYIPFSVFKTTGLSPNKLLAKVSKKQALSDKEAKAWERVQERVDSICRKGYETGGRVFVDAEESWIQDAIDNLARDMMRRYNRERCVVYNTLQMYRHDRMEHLNREVATAEDEGYQYGVKLVRGAYMEKERDRAEEMGYPSPIQANKAATDADFNKALIYCLDHLDRVSFCAGTHNEESSALLAREMIDRGLDKDDPRVYSAQLFGMSDHISFNLSSAGYNIAKYVPYGPVREVMPYLIRRAEENTSVGGQTNRELSLIIRELKRRKVVD